LGLHIRVETLAGLGQGWKEDWVRTLFIEALHFITAQQVSLHLSKNHQEEEMVYQGI